MVYRIERFSIHNGPGIRTTVFLKGCSLACTWCHSPESIKPGPELLISYHRCVLCGQCIEACPRTNHAIENGRHLFQRKDCVACGKCTRACPEEALVVCGKEMTSEEAFAEVIKDVSFYAESDGGMTLSGGEPLLQPEFALDLLTRCRAAGIHTALDTAGNVPEDVFERVVRNATDLVMLDLKVMDSGTHRDTTGSSNDRILANLHTVLSMEKPLLIRIPVVPGINDNHDNMKKLAALLTGAGQRVSIEMLRFHSLGASKYTSLDLPCPTETLVPPDRALLAELGKPFTAKNIPVSVRSETGEW